MPEESDPPQPPSPDEVTQMMTPPMGGCPIFPERAESVPKIIGDFELQSKLGQGGMGQVWTARQISLRRTVALKLLPARFMEDAPYVSRFQREARVAASLSHANIVRVFAAGQSGSDHYIAMELVVGEDLGRRIKGDGRLSAPEALRICAEVARGLDHAWRTAHLIHRDIKPANIFLAADGVVKVGDLGLAKSTLGQTVGLTHTGGIMGTPHYISPEQARGERNIDFRSDIYSLGCTLYRMLTGEVPYVGTDAISIIRQHIDAPLPAILKVWPQCPIPLARLVGKMLKKAPRERHANYAELIAQIESVWAQIDPESFVAPLATGNEPLEDGGSPGEPLTPASGAVPRKTSAPSGRLLPVAPPTKSRLPIYCGLAALIIAITIGGVFFLLPRKEKLTTTGSVPTPTPRPPDPGPPPPPAEPWQDVLSDPAKLELSGPTRRRGDGLLLNGYLARALLPSSAGPRRDGAVRMRAVFGSSLRPQLLARLDDSSGWYSLYAKDDKQIFLERWEKKRVPPKVELELRALRQERFQLVEPLQRGQEYELELRIVGQNLTARLNGEVIGRITDTTYAEGRFGVQVNDPRGTAALVTALEVLNLDTPPASSAPPGARPAEATKDAPYVNSLGMKFVPVPITSGPTDGQRVLFSLWETRVQDYEAFVKERPRPWPQAGFEQGPTHPAVNVDWESARDFCAWLTARERQAGRLSLDEAYRLPTDHEWSCAVGIGARENPRQLVGEKNRKIPGVYPWGTDWPPPDNAANLSGEEAIGGQVEKDQVILAKYRDAYVTTAPCGTFVPNTFGLRDLGGNVWEWCEDLFAPEKSDRVLRGMSFADGNPKDNLLTSSRRHLQAQGYRGPTVGFRAVLAPVAGSL